jgi:Uma2 family endonuclease
MLVDMNIALPARLDFDEFLAWAARQEEGKYELIDGVVVMQQSQQWSHAKSKAMVYVALMEAVAKARVPFYVAPDGPTVRISKRRGFVPDALVAALPEPAPDSLEITNPVIVVEVLSPSTAKIDVTKKLSGYFEVPSIQHYLIVDAEGRTITHHRRSGSDVLETRIVGTGTLRFDPPGIEIDVARIFPATSGNA